MIKNALGVIVALAICFAVAGLGAYWTTEAIPTWYATLRKPSWNPPNWVFGPVWSILYAMMAVSAWLVWRRAEFEGARVALAVFAVQLALNLGWSGVFFRLKQPGWAFAEIVLLWLVIAATIVRFRRISATAASLLVPYLLWVSFATALNAAIWRLNA